MSWGDLPEWARVATQLSAIIGAILLGGKLISLIGPPVKRGLRKVMFFFTRQETFDGINHKIDAILHEVTNNDGGSLKDSVNRIESKVNFLGASRRARMNVEPVARVEADNKGNVTWASPAMQKLVGRPEHELLGSGWVIVLHPDERKEAEENWQDTVVARRMLDTEHTYVTTDGALIRVHVVATPLYSDEGQFLGHIAEITPV